MTLIQLEYFCAVCRYNSITRAAAELFVSQPTISVALRNLEDEFRLRLFNHGKNQISLTQDGEAFYKKAEELLADCQNFQTEFANLSGTVRPIRVGIPPMLSSMFFPEIMIEFHKIHKDPMILKSYGSMRACTLVDQQELDVAVANLDFYNVDKFNYHVMMKATSIFCIHKSHPLANEKTVSLEQIGDFPIILFNTDSVINKTIISRYRSINMTPNILMYSSQLSTMIKFVKENLAGAFVYNTTPISDPDLVCVPVIPTITSNIGLVWKKDIYISEATTRFIKFVQNSQMW